jgi:hypothetical protein
MRRLTIIKTINMKKLRLVSVLLVLMCHSIIEMKASSSCWGVRWRPPFKTSCKDHCVEAVDDCVPGKSVDTPAYWIAFQPGDQYATRPRQILLNPSGTTTPCNKQLNLMGVYSCMGSLGAEIAAGGVAATAAGEIVTKLMSLTPIGRGVVIGAAVVVVVGSIDRLFGGPLKWCTYCEMLSCVDDVENTLPAPPILVVDPTALTPLCPNRE